MGAQLAATVYVTDPDTHQQVRLEPGTCPEPRLAALVTAKNAWIDGKLPRLPKTAEKKAEGDQDPTGDGQDGASGDTSQAPGDGDQPTLDDSPQEAAPAAKKTAARQSAARKPARGRDAAEQGDSGE